MNTAETMDDLELWAMAAHMVTATKSGKFALVARSLGSAWKLSQTMRPAVLLSPGD